MTGKRKASDETPGTPRPPAPCREAESDEEYLSPSAYLVSGDTWSDGEQSPRVVLPPPPSRDTRSNNLMSARGLSDGGTAAGEEDEVSSPWRLVVLSELIVLQPAAADQPAAAVAQADHSSAEAVVPAPTLAPALETAACAHDVCFSFPAGATNGSDGGGGRISGAVAGWRGPPAWQFFVGRPGGGPQREYRIAVALVGIMAMKGVIPKTGPFFVATLRPIPAGALVVTFAAARGRKQPSGWAAWGAIAAFGLVDIACFQVDIVNRQ
ncbi:hypothetical protein ACQ4PT_047297 [Festuca glaucescens]